MCPTSWKPSCRSIPPKPDELIGGIGVEPDVGRAQHAASEEGGDGTRTRDLRRDSRTEHLPDTKLTEPVTAGAMYNIPIRDVR
jgi:hypothetical protein